MHPTIKYILFDLDSTLYSARYGLENNVSARVNEYIARRLNMEKEAAWAYRKERILACNYGTTIDWLRAEQGLADEETDDYFRFIHPENETDPLPPDPSLEPFLRSLPLPMAILTNAPREHALRILKKLGVAEDLFISIFDIRTSELKGKPHREVFQKALDALEIDPASCLFVDDVLRYIEGYQVMGGTAVLVDEDDRHADFRGFRVRTIRELPLLRWDNGDLLIGKAS